jgi:hypothetical protein
MALVAAAFLAYSDANAQQTRGKTGFGIAYGKSEHAFDANATSGTGTERSTTAAIWFGYDFTPTFGAQVNYWWLADGYGLPPVSVSQGGGSSVVYTDATRDVHGWSVSGTANWPVKDWLRLTGRAGVFFWSSEISAPPNSFCFSCPNVALRSAHGQSFTYGAGLLIGQGWGFRLDYDGFSRVDQSRIQTLTGGIFWGF